MRIPIIPIGNSRGIRIPKSILRQLDMPDQVDLEVHEKEIVLKPAKRNSREGWCGKWAGSKRNIYRRQKMSFSPCWLIRRPAVRGH